MELTKGDKLLDNWGRPKLLKDNKMKLTDKELAEMLEAMQELDFGPELDTEILDEETAAAEEFYYENDGQPSEYDEWQDVYGGDDWDHGQYDHDYYDGGIDF